MPLALLALAVSAFGIGTTEFVMMGLLPNVADDLGTSVPTAGYLVSAYAIGVVLGAPLLTGLGSQVPRKRMLLLLMALFTVGNLASALAPDFGWLIAGRLLAGLPHGAFFGVGAVVATRLVSEGRQARAVATMFLGLTVANIVGVPRRPCSASTSAGGPPSSWSRRSASPRWRPSPAWCPVSPSRRTRTSAASCAPSATVR